MAAGLGLLDGLDAGALAADQPFWATRAHLLALAGRDRDAAAAREPAVAAWLRRIVAKDDQ